MGRRRQAGASTRTGEPVSWRDGVHITGTPIWCDARRARDVCFLSSAHAAGTSRHGQLVATATTLALLSREPEDPRPHSQLPIPYDRPFSLGQSRLELVRSGHALGSASLSVTADGERVLYAGAVDPSPGGLGGAADLRPCDTLVVTATYGEPRFSFPAGDRAARGAVAFALDVARQGGVPVLLVSSPSKALDVLARLGAEDLAASAHRSIHLAAQKLRAAGVTLPPLARAGATAAPGSALLWPAASRGRLDAVALPAKSRVALVSGDAIDPEAVTAIRADTGFAWSNQADFSALLDYVEQSGAGRVYVTGRHADRFADACGRPGRQARPLGPPQQMQLF